MSIDKYGVLKGKAIESKREDDQSTPHFQVHIVANDIHYRIAVNVMSQVNPPDLLFLADEDFHHPITAQLPALSSGFNKLESRAGVLALDYIRGNLFNKENMKVLPPNKPGADNDLSDKIDHYVKRAINEGDAVVYAFGEAWGPETDIQDKIFGFKPGNGIHDIHMNQGNDSKHMNDDGVWQDGALIFHFPSSNQWTAIFLAFQSQAWHTDDETGHAITDGGSDGVIKIIAAMVNPIGPAPERETVTLLNTSPAAINLLGWKIANNHKKRHSLSGIIGPGETLTVILSQQLQLGNNGGIITLLDNKDLKVDGVSYTAEQAQKEGWTIVF